MFHNSNNKINKINIHIQHFSRKHNTCQNQSQSVYDIFQTNLRAQNSKESNSQNTLKTLYVGNLNKSISEEDLHEPFGLWNITYLKENCCVKVVLSKSGLSRGFAFVTAPDHVCTELIKLNGIDFKSHRLAIEEALVKPKVKEPSPPGNKTTEIKNYQTSFEEVPVVPSVKSYSKATSSQNSVFSTIPLQAVYQNVYK